MENKYEKHLHHLESLDLTREQKLSCIEAIYNFLQSPIDIAFGVHPIQLARGYSHKSNLQIQNKRLEYENNPNANNSNKMEVPENASPE